jgi:serine protease Do
LVTAVDEKSEAYRRGLRPGMVVEQVNQQDVKSFKDITDAIKSSGRKSVLLRVADERGSTLLVIPKGKE